MTDFSGYNQSLQRICEAYSSMYEDRGEHREANVLAGTDVTVEKAEELLREDVAAKLYDASEEFGTEIRLVGLAVHGSRARGTNRADSDLDVVFEYEGDVSEDDLFDFVNGDPIEFYGLTVDLNPIRADKTGSLDDYMDRSRQYDAEITGTRMNEADAANTGAETPTTQTAAKPEANPQDGAGTPGLGKDGRSALNGALLGAGAGAAAGALTHMMKSRKERRRGSMLGSMASGAMLGGAAGGALGYGVGRWGDTQTATTQTKTAVSRGTVNANIDLNNVPEVLKDINPNTGKPYKYEELDPESATGRQVKAMMQRRAEEFNNLPEDERIARQEQADANRAAREKEQRVWDGRVAKARMRRYDQDRADMNRVTDRNNRLIQAHSGKDYDYLLNGQYNIPH